MTTFPKREHIVSTRLIDLLFGSGSKALVAYPLRVVYRLVPRQQTGVEAQMLISVPKKRFKHAVDRNRLKRQVREAYRHQKEPLVAAVPADQCLLIGFVWIADEHTPSTIVNSRMEKLLKRIGERLKAEG